MTERRHYSAETKAEAVGLAVSVGVKEAGRRLSIPYRTISHWMARPEAQVLILTSRQDALETLKVAAAEGAASLLAIIRNPKAADRDKVRATEVAIDRYQLLSGSATERTENMNLNLEAGWGSEAYADATDEIKAASQSILSDAMTEIVAGTTALRVAGATGSSMQLDGVAVRANLTTYDVRAVESFLARLEAAMEAGVDASDIIAALTAKRIGDGNG